VEDLDLSRDMSRNPLFDIVVRLQNMKDFQDEFTLENLMVFNKKIEGRRISKFDISLDFSEKGSILECNIEYNSRIYKEKTIIKFYDHLCSMLDQFISAPYIKISEVEYFSKIDKVQIIEKYNEAYSDRLNSNSMIESFERYVLDYPNNTALILNGINYTFLQLNNLINSLSIYLIREIKVKEYSDIILGVKDNNQRLIIGLSILKLNKDFKILDKSVTIDEYLKISRYSNDSILLIDQRLINDFYKKYDYKVCVRNLISNNKKSETGSITIIYDFEKDVLEELEIKRDNFLYKNILYKEDSIWDLLLFISIDELYTKIQEYNRSISVKENNKFNSVIDSDFD